MSLFIRKPFIDCPKCKEKHFGVISIGEFSYQRRCAKCGYPPHSNWSVASYPLPPLDKKVVYLDQFLISNMVKSLHPDSTKTINAFYRRAFEKLDRLSKLQIIVCPDSQFHEEESSFAKYSKEHKRVYELLSHGITYKDFWTILRYEVSEQLNCWLLGKPMGETEYTAQDFCYGKINKWQETLLVTLDNSKRLEMERERKRTDKSEIHKILQGYIPLWQSNRNMPFEYWYKREIDQWPRNFLETYRDYLLRMNEVFTGQRPMSPSDITPPPLYNIFMDIKNRISSSFPNQGEEVHLAKVGEFLNQLKCVPYIRIFAMLFASLGAKVSSGMNPDKMNEGTFNDILMISALLPFCDAIFLDNQMASFLRENPLKSTLQKMPKVFSLSNNEEFLKYLDGLENAAPPSQIEKVIEVYGESWATPYINVLAEFSSRNSDSDESDN